MILPDKGFVIHVIRERNEERGSGNTKRFRTIGRCRCLLDGKPLQSDLLSGATVEPRGPGNNGTTGVNRGLRIEAGTYPLGTHGFPGSRYNTFDYRKYEKPRPGIYVHDTGKRTAILIHKGIGFKGSVGCINLTGSIAGPDDDIGSNTIFGRLDAFIEAMKNRLPVFPKEGGKHIMDAWLAIDGEP